jgi:hypothetical protein
MRSWFLALLLLVGCTREQSAPSAERAPAAVSTRTDTPVASAVRMDFPADMDVGQLSAPSDSLRDALPRCGDGPPVADSNAIGAMRIGMTVAELRALCPAMRLGWDWGDEGVPEPAAQVNLGGALIEVVFSDTTATGLLRILSTEDALVRTTSGLRVGATVADLRAAHGPIVLADAECVLYASSPRLRGIVFRFEAETEDCVAVGQAPERPAELRGSSRVRRLFVNGRWAGA